MKHILIIIEQNDDMINIGLDQQIFLPLDYFEDKMKSCR